MSIKLEMNYQKRLGLPEYSSHSFSASLTSEVQQLDDVPAEVKRTYGLLQDAVDAEIVNPGFVPGQGTSPTEPQTPWKCSEKQQALLLKLVTEHSLDRDAIDQLAELRFGHGVTRLNRLEMSGLLDELLEQNRKRGGGQRQPTRRAA
jgi:hypothetical protein